MPIKFAKSDSGGSCSPGCHKPYAYDRNAPVDYQATPPALILPPATLATLHTDHAGAPLWVRQAGSFALSPPLLLTTIA
jgi:hypothetical protein